MFGWMARSFAYLLLFLVASIGCASSQSEPRSAVSSDGRLELVVDERVLEAVFAQYCSEPDDRPCGNFDDYKASILVTDFGGPRIMFLNIDAANPASDLRGIPYVLTFHCSYEAGRYECASGAHR